MCALSATSTSLPRYITITRWLMCRHDGQVVRDEQVREVEPALEVLQQVDDLALDGHVERGDRLVADDQARLHRSALAIPMRCRWPPLNSCG